MKVCIPTMGKKGMDEQVGEHFGRVPTYTLVNTRNDAVEVIDNTSEHMGGTGLPAEILSKLGIDAMLCGGLGRKAIGLFEESGIMVYIGASGTVRDALRAFNEKKLRAATDKDACTQHAFHDSGHEHGQEHHHHHEKGG